MTIYGEFMTKNKNKKQLTEKEKAIKHLKHIAAVFDYHGLRFLGMLLLQRHTHIKRPYLEKYHKIKKDITYEDLF